ncbi:hypothetical protein FC62_GL000368 [Amylolactobacillus amylotrophicus DSM 20534]|uniref:Uncharacterized protein n=3 Tax=Amylolactobacillus TaxID=2767876 RepID=A0A1L6XDJ7_9LACO|nr:MULTISPECIES: TetR family transcriptional regulator [Amylolactobacillus]APT19053.1 hypothetical protein LA20533_07265 [Amylolactobacillus amylophilus DSM 20533 = JCM 1125]KRK38680.1 hypothetical protein FC62_GL000368 [Amylolactobacillus amylotrophicus DSM 20534]KRM42677.1 hypothetical protein FD40_GL000471 [Amylolactobacillus amylophilus DSM 20533 = JCM 1125]GED79536.1 TetR family transcriptional regulator [Amylolactobacillus amylophilus]
MPTKTFFGLGEEKRERIVAAATAQFTTKKFSDISINELIKQAGIPRGSFYQYFLSKEDLFFYLAKEKQKELLLLWQKQLQEAHGDLFLAFQTFANKEIDWQINDADQMFFRNMFVFMGDHKASQWFEGDSKPHNHHHFTHFGLDLIDTSKLRVKDESELELLFQIMIGLLVQIGRSKLIDQDNQVDQLNKNFRLKVASLVRWLKYGVLKEESNK